MKFAAGEPPAPVTKIRFTLDIYSTRLGVDSLR
jgi:hypothetical protein